MTYNDIINRLSYIYDRQEARAIARRLLDETRRSASRALTSHSERQNSSPPTTRLS